MKNTKETLTTLIRNPAVTGYERFLGFSQLYQQMMAKQTSEKTSIDQNGNVITIFEPSKYTKTIILSAHIDEVGFVISKQISPTQYKILPIGWISAEKCIDNKIEITIFDSEKAKISGIIQSITSNKVDSFDDLILNTETTNNIPLMSPVYFKRDINIQKDIITAPALDNKVGSLALLRLAGQLNNKLPTDTRIILLGLVQEEYGSSNIERFLKYNPDLWIDIDSAYGDTTTKEKAVNIPILGKGAAIQAIGKELNIEKQFLFEILETLDKEKVSYQLEIPEFTNGGTLLSKLTSKLPRFLGVNIPVMNQHANNSKSNLKDLDSAVEIVSILIEQLEL